MSVDGSVGVGRDAMSHQGFDDSMFGAGAGIDLDMFSQHSKSRDPSMQPFDMGMDIDMPALDIGDLGVDFGLPMDDGEKTPGQTRSPSRACEYFLCTLQRLELTSCSSYSPLRSPKDPSSWRPN